MDHPTLSFLEAIEIFFVTWCCTYILISNSRTLSKPKKLPPGPYPYPIVGNIFQIPGNFHESLAKLSQSYGPLISLKLGNKTIIAVSSPELAKEFLHKHDQIFSNRPVPGTVRAIDEHHKFSVVFLRPVETRWRNLRKLLKEQFFSLERLNASQQLRQEKAKLLCNYINDCCISGKGVDIAEVVFTTSLNLISNTVFSVDFAHYGSNSSRELKEIVSCAVKAVAAPNVADFFPVLKFIDPQGLRSQARTFGAKVFEIFDGIIHQRLHERGKAVSYVRKNDLLEKLLDLNQENEAEFSKNDIKHLLLDIFVGGSETSSVTVECAMAELLRNPEKRIKARTELTKIIGQCGLVQESDISRLPYLQALVKETFRLHPPVSLLLRQAAADGEIEGYIVPKDADIYVNIWGIGRDPSLWPNPCSFVPERFLEGGVIDVKGQHFELLPFGTGRRVCPGMSFGHRMVHLTLASLLHKFDWKLEQGMKPEEIDMSEVFGITTKMAVPLCQFLLNLQISPWVFIGWHNKSCFSFGGQNQTKLHWTGIVYSKQSGMCILQPS